MKKLIPIVTAAVVAGSLFTACEGMTNGVPRVEGTYTGTGTIVYVDLGQKVEASIRMVVEQAGSTVTVSGSMTLAGTTFGIDATSGTIDATGLFTQTRTSVIDPEALDTGVCGTARAVSGSLTFSGGEARYTATIQYSICGTVTMQATLTR